MKLYHFSYTLGTAIKSVGFTILSTSCKFSFTYLKPANVIYTGLRLIKSLEKSAICAVMCDKGRKETIRMGGQSSCWPFSGSGSGPYFCRL